MNFQYNYNLSGSSRKPLIEAISQILDKPSAYQGAPGFSYIIGDFTVDRNGVLSYNSNIHPDFAAILVEDLRIRGFVAEKTAIENAEGSSEAARAADTNEATDASGENATAENGNMTETSQSGNAPNQLTIEVPSTGFTPMARENLKKIVASKEALFKQAFDASFLTVAEVGDKIFFPWFTLHGLDGEADAYSRFIAAICDMAKNQKRVTAAEKPVQNAKYEMRLFLVRLGFIGGELKAARRILLRNLTGNSSWKSGRKPERAAEAGEEEVPSNPSIARIPTPGDREALTGDITEIPGESGESSPSGIPENKNDGGDSYGK